MLGQPIFPGDSGVDQLVEIIKLLGTPSREAIKEMNPNYARYEYNMVFDLKYQIFLKMFAYRPFRRSSSFPLSKRTPGAKFSRVKLQNQP